MFKVTTRDNENVVGFFREINPLSNFYPSTFMYEGIQYISSEQLIQSNKAKFFGDLDTYNQIMGCFTSLECKDLSRQIRNVDDARWEEVVGNVCHPGIWAKFKQNQFVMDTLVYKTGNKRIVECASDQLWGTGISLGDPSCLDSSNWISQGILGKILENIPDEANQSRQQQYYPPMSTSASVSQMHQPTAATFHSASQLASTMPNYSSSLSHPPKNPIIGLSNNSSVTSDPKPIPSLPVSQTSGSLDTTTSTSGSDSICASTTPVSDTTASDTDQSELQSKPPKLHAANEEESMLMEETVCVESTLIV